jgi:hypothetical protein
MSAELIPRIGESLNALRDDRATRRIRQEVALAVKVEQGAGLIKAARLEAEAYVARTALVNTAQLSADEASLIQAAPLAEPRMKHIVDAYALYAAREVGQ